MTFTVNYSSAGFWIALVVLLLAVIFLAIPSSFPVSTGVFLTICVILLAVARLI